MCGRSYLHLWRESLNLRRDSILLLWKFKPDTTALTSHENMTFLPPPELRYQFLPSAPAPKQHRGGSSV
ncbi:unnamed protein product [Brassica oleracea]